MKHNVTFEHGIGQSVEVSALATAGIVTGLRFMGVFKEYLTAYWINGARVEQWLLESELKQKS